MKKDIPKKMVYVADDDPAIVDAIRFMLEEFGYDVKISSDATVIEMVRKRKPDLLILDIWMSGADGSEICRKLKDGSETNDVPIIMISAHPDAGKISRDCGADDYLYKPFSIFELMRAIKLNIA